MIRIFKQYLSPRKLAFVIGEGILIFLAISLASYFVLGKELGMTAMLEAIWPKVILISIVTQVIMYHNDLYDLNAITNTIDLAYRLIQSIGITSISLALIYFLWPDMIIARWVFFVNLIFLLLFLICWRLIYAAVIKKKLFVEKALLVGFGDLAQSILDEIAAKKDLGYNVSAIIKREKDEDDSTPIKGVPIHYGFENICNLSETHEVGSLIVALDEKRSVFPHDQLLKCKVRGLNIIDGASFYERITGKLLVEKINPSWLIFSDGFLKSRTTRLTKRLFGLIFSSVTLIILFPFLLLVAIAIKLDTRGPVLFAQQRVGENEKLFTLYKFRSMHNNAEKKTGPVWAEKNDPRITRVGKIIRKLRVDELPQLWNVFKGDMSFVGPRPERPFFVEKLKKVIPYYSERTSVKPGVTGWAQIKYSYGSTEEDALEKLMYDLYYIKNMSIVIDFIVIFHTIKIVLLGRGAR